MTRDFCDKIWRRSIGHYGGLYVEVPKEEIESFKRMFPKSQIPRRRFIRKSIQDEGFGMEFEQKFHKEYPHSDGVYYDIYFGDRTKGLKTLETLFTKHKCYRKENWING